MSSARGRSKRSVMLPGNGKRGGHQGRGAQRTSSGRQKRQSDTEGNEVAESYVARRRVFTLLAAAVGLTGLLLVLTSVRNQPGPDVTLTTKDAPPPIYTVKVLEIPVSARDAGEQILKRPEVISLAGNNELFLTGIDKDHIALCVGRFSSAESAPIKEVVERFRNFEFNGKRIFDSACVQRFSR